MSTRIETSPATYRHHSLTSDPGRMASWLEDAPRDIAGIHDLTTRLVFHYRGGGDPLEQGFTPDRLDEINLRYADEMLARLHALQSGSICLPREATHRILGCCRDFTLLFVSLARAAGIPARSRVGFAGYFTDGWWIDHVVAEVWDAADGRWRLVDAQLPEGFPDVGTGAPLEVLDVPRDRFLVGPDAWQAARSGAFDHDRSAVAPEIDLPFLRSWGYLAHNLVVDLAAVNKDEMLLWEIWGVLAALDADPAAVPDEATADRFDALAAAMAAPDVDAAGFARLYTGDLVVPGTITRLSPYDDSSREVALRQAPVV